MIPPPVLDSEGSRLAAINRYRLEGAGREAAFDHATDLAARMFGVPISLVSIVGAEEQCFRGAHGFAGLSTLRQVSFCGHAIHAAEVLVVEDALVDRRFFDNPLVTGEPQIRFYAGAPLVLDDGSMPGTLCLIDREPRAFTAQHRAELVDLARLVVDVIQLRLDGLLAEERQHALARMKDEFVAATSHELRTPLTSIAASLQLLLGGVAGDMPERSKRLIEIAHANSTRLIGLVNDILDFDKLASGEMRFDAVPINVGPLLHEAAQANAGYANAHRVSIEISPVPAGLRVMGDRCRLVQVRTNLLANAAKFSHSGGKVVMRACPLGADGVRISVTDEGQGIPDEFKPRIFSRFAQAETSDDRHKGGTGLGLSIVKQMVAQMGGEVSFDSALGRGTEFRVDLPSAIDE